MGLISWSRYGTRTRPCSLHLLLDAVTALSFLGRQSGALALVTLDLSDPAPERLGGTSDLLGDRGDRRSLWRVLVLVLQNHPHRTVSYLRGKPAQSGHDPTLKEWSLQETRGGSLRLSPDAGRLRRRTS